MIKETVDILQEGYNENKLPELHGSPAVSANFFNVWRVDGLPTALLYLYAEQTHIGDRRVSPLAKTAVVLAGSTLLAAGLKRPEPTHSASPLSKAGEVLFEGVSAALCMSCRKPEVQSPQTESVKQKGRNSDTPPTQVTKDSPKHKTKRGQKFNYRQNNPDAFIDNQGNTVDTNSTVHAQAEAGLELDVSHGGDMNYIAGYLSGGENVSSQTIREAIKKATTGWNPREREAMLEKIKDQIQRNNEELKRGGHIR